MLFQKNEITNKMEKYNFLEKFIGENNIRSFKKDNSALTDEVIKGITLNTLQIIQTNIDKFILLFDSNYAKINFTTIVKEKTRELKLPVSTDIIETVIGRLYGIFTKKNNIDKGFMSTYINILMESLNNPNNISIDPEDFNMLKSENGKFGE